MRLIRHVKSQLTDSDFSGHRNIEGVLHCVGRGSSPSSAWMRLCSNVKSQSIDSDDSVTVSTNNRYRTAWDKGRARAAHGYDEAGMEVAVD